MRSLSFSRSSWTELLEAGGPHVIGEDVPFMEALYSKLYDKYTKLKAKKESEIDKINREQEVKFMNFASAADDMIEHLRNENNILRAQINDLRNEVVSIRSTKDEQHAEYQRLLMEENRKNKRLSEEIERLQKLQHDREDRIESRQLNNSVSSQVGSDNGHSTRKRRRHYGTDAQVTTTPRASEQLEPATVSGSSNDLSKQIVSSETCVFDQPECCRRTIGLSGGGVKAPGPANCMFQDLTECLVGMKLSAITQTDGICISALHQSSGYSFCLAWTNKAGREGEEVEVMYRVLSLGTIERVAPDWMREEALIFSTRMCPIFFERISRVINLRL